jgi:hypothetical protein
LLPSATTIAAPTQLTTMTARSQQSLFIVDGGKSGHHGWKRQLMATAAMVVFIDGGCH